MTNDLPDPLIRYLTDREAARAERVQAFLASLTRWERALFHDAAVMGYVQGLERDRSEGVPKDSQIMALVADTCFAFEDLYPAVNAPVGDRPSDVTRVLRIVWSWIADANNGSGGDVGNLMFELERNGYGPATAGLNDDEE